MKKKIHNNLCIFLLGAVYVFLVGFICYWKFEHFRYGGLDLGIFDNVFYNTLHGNFFRSTTQLPNFFAYHFSPILFLYLPLYAMLPHPLTLLLVETVFFALSLWPLALLTRKILSRKWMIPVSLVWCFSPWVINPNIFEFHAIALFPFFVFWAILFYLNNRFWLFLFFLFFALLVREDISFLAVSWSMLAFLEHRKTKWIFSPFLLGVVYFLFSLFIVRAFSNFDHYPFLSLYSWLGNGWLEIFKTFLFHPWSISSHLISLRSFIFILGILLPFGFLPLLGWRYLFLHLFTFLQLAMMGDGPSAAAFKMHYVILFVPGLFLAYLFGIQKILNEKRFRSYQQYIGLIVVFAVFYSAVFLGPLNLFLESYREESSGTIENKKELLALIPQNAKILVSDSPLALVSTRSDVFLLRYLLLGKTQYQLSHFSLPNDIDFVLVDLNDMMMYDAQYREHLFYKDAYVSGASRFREFLEKEHFILRRREGAWLLWQRNFKEDEPQYIWKEHSEFPEPIEVRISQKDNAPISLIGATEKNKEGELFLNLFWKKEKEIHENFAVLITLQNKNGGDPITYYELLGGGIFPTRDWNRKNIVETQHTIALQKENFSRGMYTVQLSLFRFRGGIELDALSSPYLSKDSTERIGTPYTLAPIFLSL